MKTTTRIPALALLATLALTIVGCDAPEAADLELDRDAAVEVLRFSADELGDRLRADGRDEEAEAFLAGADADELSAAPQSQGTMKSLEECLATYCFNDSPAYWADGQCEDETAEEHPFGMVGVCVIAEVVEGCEVWMYHGEYCSVVAGPEQTA
ncbi:MAG: hypothetical protein H6710_14400 [Myxococcales bacterium]|nr:hypothetical protein [Myxococcales bacterium]MCB9705102.1 hypothetical protein [Myxococcales bacterium]